MRRCACPPAAICSYRFNQVNVQAQVRSFLAGLYLPKSRSLIVAGIYFWSVCQDRNSLSRPGNTVSKKYPADPADGSTDGSTCAMEGNSLCQGLEALLQNKPFQYLPGAAPPPVNHLLFMTGVYDFPPVSLTGQPAGHSSSNPANQNLSSAPGEQLSSCPRKQFLAHILASICIIRFLAFKSHCTLPYNCNRGHCLGADKDAFGPRNTHVLIQNPSSNNRSKSKKHRSSLRLEKHPHLYDQAIVSERASEPVHQHFTRTFLLTPSTVSDPLFNHEGTMIQLAQELCREQKGRRSRIHPHNCLGRIGCCTTQVPFRSVLSC